MLFRHASDGEDLVAGCLGTAIGLVIGAIVLAVVLL